MALRLKCHGKSVESVCVFKSIAGQWCLNCLTWTGIQLWCLTGWLLVLMGREGMP